MAQISELQEKLSKLEPVNPEKVQVNKAKAIQMLAPQISSMREKGYDLSQICQVLAAEGLDLSTGTLKNYLALGGKPKKAPAAARTTSVVASVAPKKLVKAPQNNPGPEIAEKPEEQTGGKFQPRRDIPDDEI